MHGQQNIRIFLRIQLFKTVLNNWMPNVMFPEYSRQ